MLLSPLNSILSFRDNNLFNWDNCAKAEVKCAYTSELTKIPEAAAQLKNIIDETLRVSAELGRESWGEDLREQVYQITRATAQIRSSMLQDVEAGRAVINGHLLSLAAKLPANQTAFDTVKSLI